MLDETTPGAGFDARLSLTIEREIWEKWVLMASVKRIVSRPDGGLRRSSWRRRRIGWVAYRRDDLQIGDNGVDIARAELTQASTTLADYRLIDCSEDIVLV